LKGNCSATVLKVKPRWPQERALAPWAHWDDGLRRARQQIKASGGFRTRAGAEHFACMRGLMETARKQGRELLQARRRAVEGRPTAPWKPSRQR